tara:strand:+ start:569 stop:1429 length:861 start_codon:yes stop_codon:yes gene_type:complete
MLINLVKYICVVTLFFSCSTSNKLETNETQNNNQLVSPVKSKSENLSSSSENEFVDQQISFEMQKMLSEINFLKQQVNTLELQSSMYTNPFSIYNKEIILNNGSSIFCKIISQDENEIFVETLIGNLTLKRENVVRVVENVIVLEEDNLDQQIIEISTEEEESILKEADLIKQRKSQSSASIIILGDIKESKDKTGNTIFNGELKNIGTERGDLVRIDFILKKNFQGDIERLTAYANGSTHIFKDTGIISNSSIKPGAVGSFQIIIPKSIGNFIGYSYELHWDHYE